MRFAICNLVVAIAFAIGCDGKPVEQKPLPVVEKSGPGVVRGRVTFGGTIPQARPIDNSICKHAGPILDETVVVGNAGGLKNAVVYVAGIRGPLDLSPGVVELDQKDCRFSPHVLAVRVGQVLRIRNSDPEMHNVHGNPSANAVFNHGFKGPGSRDMTFTAAEFIRVKCDVHPWMTAYVGVFDSSYFAVTGDDGGFEITGLPAGTYDLRVWHERFGELKQSVTVESGAADTAFVYKPPQ